MMQHIGKGREKLMICRKMTRLIPSVIVSLVLLAHAVSSEVFAQAANAPGGHSARFFLDQGQKQLEQKRFAIAVRTLSAAIRRDPHLAEAYRLRGQALDQMGVPQRAVRDFTKYIEMKPSDAKGYIQRGDVHNFNLDHEMALSDYNHAIKLQTSSVSAHLGRGLAYAGLGKYEEAIKDYQVVLRSNPDQTEALANMGVACMLRGRSMEAMNYFERALKSEKDPQWREQMEKWIANLLQSPKASGPGKSGKPLW